MKTENLLHEKLKSILAEYVANVNDSDSITGGLQECIVLSQPITEVKQVWDEYVNDSNIASRAHTYGYLNQKNISNIAPFGVFVSLKKADGTEGVIDGLVHISEVSWEKVEDLQSRFQPGEEVEAIVMGVDAEAKRVELSIKRLTEDPFGEVTVGLA